MDKGKLFRRVKHEFKQLGYSLKYDILNAVDYGVPQQRERLILVGFKGENPFKFPLKTHGEGSGLKPYVTLKDAIGDLLVLKSGQGSDHYMFEPNNDFLKLVRDTGRLTEHVSPKNGPHLIRIMETLKDGQGKNDLPENIRPIG